MAEHHATEDYYWGSQRAKHREDPSDPRAAIAEAEQSLAAIESYINATASDFGDPKLAEVAERHKRRLIAAAKTLSFRCRAFYDAVTADESAANAHC